MANGDVYIGQFKNGLFDGKGQLILTTNEIYNGFFQEGKKSGDGLEMLANGDKYDGNFTDGKYDGYGLYTLSTGQTKEGIWNHGEYVKQCNKAEAHGFEEINNIDKNGLGDIQEVTEYREETSI